MPLTKETKIFDKSFIRTEFVGQDLLIFLGEKITGQEPITNSIRQV